MALGEPASLASVSTSPDSSASGCVNGKTKRTSRNRSVESASTSSFLTNPLSRCTSSSVDAVLTHHRGEESPPAKHRGKVYLSRSSSPSAGKCVLGPFEEADSSDYRSETAKHWKDLPQVRERRRPAEVASGSSPSSPARLNDGTAAATLQAQSTLLTEDTSVFSTSQPESVSVSCLPRAKKRPPDRLNSSSKLASSQPDGVCQQTEAGRGFYPSREDNLAPVEESHRTPDTDPCTSRGSRAGQVGEHVSYRKGTVRLPLQGRSARNEAESRLAFGGRGEVSPPLPSSGPSSLSSTIPCLSGDSVCSVNSHSHSSNACNGATIHLRKSAPGLRQNAKPRFETAGTPAATALHLETETAQGATQQHSEPRARHREDHRRSLLRGRPVNKTSHGAPHEAVSSEATKKHDVLFQNELPLHSRVHIAGSIHRGEQQPFRSSAVSVHPQPSCPGSRIVRGRRRRTGEHAAFVLNEVEQLQQILRKECIRGSLFRRNSVQRRFRQLQSALRHLLSSLNVEDEDLAKAAPQLRAAHQTLSRAGGSSAAPGSKGYSTTSQHSTTSKGNGACCRADIAHDIEHVRSVEKMDAPVDCTCLRQNSAARTGGNAQLPRHSEVRTIYASRSLGRDSESSACASVTEEAGASHFHLPSSTSSACTEHTEVTTQNVSCPPEVVSPADSPGEPLGKVHADNANTNSVTDAVTQNVSRPLEVVSPADSPGEPSRKVHADNANTNSVTDAVTIRVDTSYLSKEPEGTELLDTVERRCRQCFTITRRSATSADGLTSRKGHNAKYVDVAPCGETSFSDYRKDQLPGQSCSCHDASMPQSASDCNSRCHQSPSTVREDDSLKCREFSTSDGNDNDYGSSSHGHYRKESAPSKQTEETSEASQNSRAIMGGSLALQQEAALCATVRRSVVARSLRIRLRRTVSFRAKCRRRTPRHVSRPRTRESLSIPKAFEKCRVAPQVQQVCQDDTFLAYPRQATRKHSTPSVEAKTPISAESGVAAWSSEENVGTPAKKRRQPGSSHHLTRFSPERQSAYQAPTRVVPQLRRLAAEGKPADNSTTSSSPPDCRSEEHSHGVLAGNADGETTGAPEANHTYQPVAKVQRAGSRGESAQVEAVSASPVKVQLVQAIWDLLHQQLAEKGKVKLARSSKSSSRLSGVVPQVGLPKGGSLSLTDLFKEAHSGLLLAFLGIVAGCGSADAIKELCKLLLAPSTEQTQEKKPGAGAEKSGQRSRRAEENVLIAEESDSQVGLHSILPQQKFSAVLNKESVRSGGWTAGRAAARFAQKECKHQHQKGAGNYDVTQEDSRHLESKSVSSAPKRRPPRAKTAHYPIEAVDWLQSGQRDETATELTFREEGRVLKQTAKQAAHLDGKEHEVVRHPAKVEHHSNGIADAQHHEPRRERPKLSVSTLHPLKNVRRSSQGSSVRSSMLSTKIPRTAGTSQSNSHTVEVRGARPPRSPFRSSCDQQQDDFLLKQPPGAASACRSYSPVTDEEGFSPEDLPSFDDIFDVPDLIPDAWYEDAEGRGSAGDLLMSGTAQNNQMAADGCKEAGQWVLEPETSALPFDASGVTGDFQPGFFDMVLEEKKRASSSKLSPSTTPAAGLSFSQLPALWDIPDDLVELVESVPGGSPSALRPPCALRLLPTSSSSSSPSSPSPPASPSSSSNSSTSSSPGSASSLAASSSSPSRPSSVASVPPKEERPVEEVARTAEGQPHVHHCPSKVLTREPYSPAETGGNSKTSSEYDERSDAEFSLSHNDNMDNLSFKATDETRDHTCGDDEEDVGATATGSALTYTRGVGFLQRALAHEGVRRRFDQPPPEFINMCYRKNPLSPRQRRQAAQARQKLGDRRSRTQPPPEKKARDRAAKVRKHRRRHQREECLMQRLASLHRHNLSHREYMGQFARRMSLAAVHKVFCIEFTKAERCTSPYTIKSCESCTDTCDSARSVPCNDPLATETAWWSTPRGEPLHDHAECVFAARSLCLQEKGTSPNTSVLTIEGCIADQLRQRGWVMNRLSSDSHFFDLKWKLSDADEDYRSLRREQFFNHFQNNRVITTKAGLARSLRRLAVEEQVQIDLFFPRCYHLSILDECSDFLLDYSRSEAVTVLLAYLRCYQASPEEFHVVMASIPTSSKSSRRSATLLLWMAYHIASVWLHELNPDLYLDRVESLDQQGRLDPQRLEVFASHAWCFRSQTPAFLREWHAIAQCAKELNASDRDGEAEDATALSLVPKEKLIPWNTKNVSRAPLGSQVLRLLKQLQRWWPLWPLERGNFDLENLKACEDACGIHESVIGNEAGACDKERKPRGNPGDGVASHFKGPIWKQHNVWVMKPSSNSKASGIQCLNNPWEILRAGETVISKLGRGLSDRLIQKYVERPLLLPCHRKFDMRQWVLVRSFSPLQVYVFSTLYLRLCSETYDLRDLQNRFRHVSNRHLNKLNNETQPIGTSAPTKEPQVSTPRHAVSNTAPALDSCKPSSVLEAMLAERTGNPQFFQENVMPQIRHIVLQTLRAARPSVISRPNSFELYGFDILLDEAYRAWLIEVNLSPACTASAPWQKQLVKQMTSELLNLLFRSNGSAAVRKQTIDSSDGDHWTLVFDELVDPEEAVDTFPPIEPKDKTLAANCTRIRKNPFLPFYSQPNHKRSRWALAAVGDMRGLCSAGTRAEDKSRSLQGVGSAAAAASWDRMAVIGEQLSRQAEAALDSWCRFTEARKRIITWWRRTAWRRRAARRKKLALCEDVEVDYFFGLL